ncbi:hypothetical protein SVAN01_07231 [Stagonosporopsis vannaccii]|nr:hypothetical protein SVAN01_07231 [Stagonosporopsis vannaccii]
MRWSIELGRAVLSTPAANLELWLRTLITISPQQQCTDLEQHNAASLLGILSSGKVWVGRGNGLYIDLDITFKHQPVADEQLRRLSEDILVAPVWKQLGLQPLSHVQSPGKLRIAVTYAHEGEAPTEKQRHRTLPSTPATDVRPPEGVPSMSLDSILLSVDIFKLPERKKTATGKRLKMSTSNGGLSQPRPSGMIDSLELELSGATLFTSPASLKRARTLALPTIDSGPYSPQVSLDIGDLETLIDGSLQVSILGRINNKMLPGVKLKASTFEVGLADIAPILWKPGFLSSLSQRASLVPIISRSIGQAATTRISSPSSLEKKLSAVATPSPFLQIPDQESSHECASVVDTDHLAPNFASRLWLYLQRNIPCKSWTVLRSFVSSASSSSLDLPIDEILEESGREGQIRHRSSLLTVGPARGETSGYHQILEDCPAAATAYCELLPQQPVPRVMTTPGHRIKEVEDELLLGDGCFEPLNVVTLYGNQISCSQTLRADLPSHACETNRLALPPYATAHKSGLHTRPK